MTRFCCSVQKRSRMMPMAMMAQRMMGAINQPPDFTISTMNG
jgi:hypothetical protein